MQRWELCYYRNMSTMALTAAERTAATRCRLMQELGPDEKATILSAGKKRYVVAGEAFFHQGAAADALYLVTEGRARLSQVTEAGEQVVVGYVEPGGGLGIIVAICGIPYPLTAEAVDDCTSIAWSSVAMRELMRTYPQLALNALDMIADRFVQLQTQFSDMATKRVEQRVARTLLRLARQFGKRTEKGLLVDMILTRQELAEMTGTNLYNVSRIMSQWERSGWLRSEHQKVLILKAHELVALGEDL